MDVNPLRGRAAAGLAVLLAVVLGAAGTAFGAEVTFKDAPAKDHWAEAALDETMVGRILIGYPDGTFRGEQVTTRYELAMALSRLYALVREVMKKETVDPESLAKVAAEVAALRSELDARSGALDQKVGALDQKVCALDQEVEALDQWAGASEERTAALERQVAELGDHAGAVDRQTKTLEQRLQTGLAALGSRTNAVEDRLSALDGRTAALEKDRVTTGDLEEVRRKLEGLAEMVLRQQQEVEKVQEQQQALLQLPALQAPQPIIVPVLQPAAPAQPAQEAAVVPKELEERMARQEAALELARKNLAQLADQLSQVVADLADERKSSVQLAEQLSDLRKALDPVGVQLAALRQADEAMTIRLSAVEESIKRLDKADVAATGRLQDHQQALDDLRLRVEALEEETGKLKDNLRRMGWLIALGAAAVAVF